MLAKQKMRQAASQVKIPCPFWVARQVGSSQDDVELRRAERFQDARAQVGADPDVP